ncbi:MAG: DUF5050 domain-containing protein [Ardenticatenaceae bacterium]|nr:DUF5050 domain-containing protein [Ardenticatenaceae bacterium]
MKRIGIGLVILFISLFCLTTFVGRAAPEGGSDPTFVNYGNRLAPDGSGTLFYTTDRSGDDAIVCTNNPEAYQYGRVTYNGVNHAHTVLETGCDVPQAKAIAADDTHLYYVYGAFTDDGHAFRQPINGGTPEQIISLGAVEGAVAVDDTHVYYALNDPSNNGISMVKVAKDSLVLEIVASIPTVLGSEVNDITLDDNYIYWTEGDDLSEGAVRAVAKTGGAIFTATNTAELAWDILIDGEYVYWSELGGRIRRRLKTGGTPETVYESNDPVYGIFIEGSTLYFGKGTTNGSLWKMPKAGGTATLMTYDRFYPNSVAIQGSRLYWAESNIYYLDKSTTSNGVDYVIDKMEVTQGVQNGANSVPLVQDKVTYVRVYAHETQGPATRKVNAYLYGFDDSGTPLHGSPLTPVQKVDLDSNGSTRAQPDQGFVFILPVSWTADTFRLQAEVNPADGNRAFELNYNNNTFPASPVTYNVNERVACLVTYPVQAVDAGDNPVVPDLADDFYFQHLERATSLLPADLHVTTNDLLVQKVTITIGPGGIDLQFGPYNMSLDADRSEVMSKMADFADLSTPPEGCVVESTAYAAIVHGDAFATDPDDDNDGVLDDPFNYGGQGNPSTQSMWSKLWVTADHQPFNQPRGAVTVAHEIGHVFGRPHVDCGSPKNPDPNYPYDNQCYRDFSNDENAHWGFDGLSLLAIDPRQDGSAGAGDLMSYRKNRWPSAYTWDAIYDAIADAYAQPKTNGALLQEGGAGVIWVRGYLDEVAGTGSLQPVYWYDEADLTESQQLQLAESIANQGEMTDYAIELVAANNSVLLTQPFVPGEEGENPEFEPLVFHVTMPFEVNTAVIRLVERNTQTVLDSIQLSSNAPAVQFDGPAILNGDGTMSLAWTGTDGDDDLLRYVLQYSPDGVRKIALVVDGVEDEMTLPIDYLPGSATGMLILYATDGVNTSPAVTLPLALPENEPVAAITAPGEDEVLFLDEPVVLRGEGWDVEDGLLPEDGLTWYVDGDMVGNGRILPLLDLPAGAYTARLEVVDSDGMTAAVEHRFVLAEAQRIYLPLVMR